MQVWVVDVDKGFIKETLQGNAPLAVDSSGKTLYFRADGKFQQRDLATGEIQPKSIAAKGRAVAVSSDGKLALAAPGNQSMCLYRLPSCEQLSKWPQVDFDAELLAFSPDGKLFAAAFQQSLHGLRVYETESGKELARVDMNGKGITCDMSFWPDGKRLLSSGAGGKLYVWDAKTLKLENTIDTGIRTVAHLSIHGCGCLLTGRPHVGGCPLSGPSGVLGSDAAVGTRKNYGRKMMTDMAVIRPYR